MATKTIYLDAAGDPGWPPPFGRRRAEWYVLAGLAMDPQTDMRTSEEIDGLMAAFIPERERAKWPDKHYEVHYHDIIHGKNVFSHLEDEQRKEMSDKIFDIIVAAKPVMFATAISKVQMKRIYGDDVCSPRLLAMRATIGRFSMYLEREQHIGSVVVDEEEYKRDKEIRQAVYELKRLNEIPIQGAEDMPIEGHNPKRILNAINMCPSEMSTGIQMVDVCSRAIWGHFEKQKSYRFRRIEPLFDHGKDKMCEPSVIPAYDKWL